MRSIHLAAFLILGTTGLWAEVTPYELGPDDRIQIRAVDVDEFPLEPVRIDARGIINLPILGRVEAGGKTISELEDDLSQRLAEYLVEPLVTVTVAEFRSQPVLVFGAVERPGVLQIHGPMTLWEVLSEAGGLKKDVGNLIRITRRLEQGPIPLPGNRMDETGKYDVAEIPIESVLEKTDPDKNIPIRPHDVVFVAREDVVYVIGHVNKPGGFMTKGNLTVLEALTLAGGYQPYAAPKKATVLRVRDDSSQRQQIAIDLKGVLNGTEEDIRLQSDDILHVPHSGWKEFSSKTLSAALAVATGVAIYRVGWDR